MPNVSCRLRQFYAYASTHHIRIHAKQSPVLLEINTNRSKLKDVVEKIIKAKLGMNLPLVMNASNLLYEAGDIEEDMVAIYDANLEKVCFLSLVWKLDYILFSFFNYSVQVLAELPSPVTGGTMLTVEDFQQELKCNINIKHRFCSILFV